MHVIFPKSGEEIMLNTKGHFCIVISMVTLAEFAAAMMVHSPALALLFLAGALSGALVLGVVLCARQ